MKPGSKDGLINELDVFFTKLMEEANPPIPETGMGDDGPKIGFVDKLRLFDSGVKWVQVKNKIDPDGELDEFAEARRKAYGARGGGAAAKANGRASA